MSESWQTFQIEELDTIAFTCQQCKTETVFRVTGGIINLQSRACAGCNRELPDAAALVSMYQQFYERAKGKAVLRAKA